jgi:hypothetical protein
MPDPVPFRYISTRNPADLTEIRIPGLDKQFEELTISELVQLRPSSALADTYEVNGVGDNISVTTSALLNQLSKISGPDAIRLADKLRQIPNSQIDIR